MSLSVTISDAIDKVIETFISKVSDKYKIDSGELKLMWNGNEQKQTKTIHSNKNNEDTKKVSEIDPNTLLNHNKAELIALCKTHGHKCSGTKSILINRLLGKEQSTADSSQKKSIVSLKKVENTPVAKKLIANIPNILIRRNQFNNYEHPETGLIFDNSTKIVIGKQNADGSIDDLIEEDIHQCNAFKFKFKLPHNLDHKSSLDDIKIDDLEDDEDDEYDNSGNEEEDDDEEELELELNEEEDLIDEDEILGDDDEYFTDE